MHPKYTFCEMIFYHIEGNMIFSVLLNSGRVAGLNCSNEEPHPF